MAKLNPAAAPVETKVVASGAYGAVTLIVTWILATYVFHGRVPADLAGLLPGFVALVLGTAAGWLSRHTPRVEEVVTVVRRELAAQQRAAMARQAAAQPPPPPGPAVTIVPKPDGNPVPGFDRPAVHDQ